MSQENVEVVSRWAHQLMKNMDAHRGDPRSYGAELQDGELDPGTQAAVDLLHPEISWTSPLGEVYEGRLECLRFAGQLLDASQSYSVSLRDVKDLGRDQVLAEYVVDMRGATSGIGARFPIAVVFTVREGLISRMVEYRSRREALKAVGPTE